VSNPAHSRKLSLSRELLLLAGSVEALRLAAERVVDPAQPRETLQHFAAAMAGGLILLRDRLRQVERVVMGIDNPADILCPANEADESEEGLGVLCAWTAGDEVEHCAAEYEGAKNRMAWENRPKGRPHTFLLHKEAERHNGPDAPVGPKGNGK